MLRFYGRIFGLGSFLCNVLCTQKLVDCDLVVKAYDYELRSNETENKIMVLMEKGDKDLRKLIGELKDVDRFTPSKLRCLSFPYKI